MTRGQHAGGSRQVRDREASSDGHGSGPEPAAAIRLEGVTKAFGSNRVLDGVTMTVPEGCGFVILGRSGTGKSVALRHIIGLIRPDQGRVFVGGTDITELEGEALSSVRKQVGFLFQSAALFDSISVGENVAFPLRRHTDLPDAEIRQRARAKLEAVGLGGDYDKMPGDLSGGMRKRAGLARARNLDPKTLLVDEPSAGLDPITSDEIDDLLLELKQEEKTTLVIVTHNMTSARKLGDQLVMLDRGRIVAQGTPEELATSDHQLVQAFMSSSHSG